MLRYLLSIGWNCPSVQICTAPSYFCAWTVREYKSSLHQNTPRDLIRECLMVNQGQFIVRRTIIIVQCHVCYTNGLAQWRVYTFWDWGSNAPPPTRCHGGGGGGLAPPPLELPLKIAVRIVQMSLEVGLLLVVMSLRLRWWQCVHVSADN